MKVKFRTIAAHPEHGCCQPGQIKDVAADWGKDLVTGGYAVEVDEQDQEVAAEKPAAGSGRRESGSKNGGKEKAAKGAGEPKG